MGAVQGWTYVWVRQQKWCVIVGGLIRSVVSFLGRYTPPPTSVPSKDGDNKLESTNYENSVLFLISCIQYILVAAVFSIGPPYRKSMWTNGWLMCCIGLLSGFNMLVLLAPPHSVSDVLTLMPLPVVGRYSLLVAAVVNVVISMVFEEWGTPSVSTAVGLMVRWWQRGRRRI